MCEDLKKIDRGESKPSGGGFVKGKMILEWTLAIFRAWSEAGSPHCVAQASLQPSITQTGLESLSLLPLLAKGWNCT